MKQYDKIYVPHNKTEHGVFMDDNYHITHEGFGGRDFIGEVVPVKNVIVLTIEELREMWAAAGLWNDYPQINPNFEGFLKEKGIKID